ncbi:tetratricopeptide repeat protein 25 [Orussus abietinus]|uniref:tetratricopeptide repeat protein 25 n=1 Tax=Orussus abietinus TaxID=222816 RepID=UPI000C715C1B|nr:tetratricopeptide repeat protein 25 [Orussus abietinus]
MSNERELEESLKSGGEIASTALVAVQASEILKATLHDHDFLQSFVRIGLDDDSEEKLANSETEPAAACSGVSVGFEITKIEGSSDKPKETTVKSDRSQVATKKKNKRCSKVLKMSLDAEMKDGKSKKKRRRRGRHQEEIYTDKDRAAAVNMGTHDIKQSLKIKRRQDRSRALCIPEEAEPGTLLALGAREMRSGDINTAIDCINKALHLSPGDKNALLARSKCYLLLGDPQKALDDAEAALRGKSKDVIAARAMFYKAEALYHLGDFELSLVFYYRGMRIRPEFDQFRLGVQKAKEAIQNILGDAEPIPIAGFEDPGLPAQSEGPEKPEISTPETPATEESKSPPKDRKEREISTNGLPADGTPQSTGKRKSTEPNLLGQLNVDKRYLQNLLKRPDVKAAHQESADHITVHAEEGIAFLKARQEFWRQQHATNQPAS